MKRYISNRVIVDGIIHRLSIVTIDDNGEVDVKPFTGETHSTRWVDSDIIIDTTTAPCPSVTVGGRPINT